MERRDKAEQGAMKSSAKGKAPGKLGESMFVGEGASGLKVSPKSVLVMSLIFIASVVVLHFFDKLKA
jgi:hypothetical protein